MTATEGNAALAATERVAGRASSAAGAVWRVGAFCATLLLLLLPALVAARHLGEPVRPDELARLARALDPADGGGRDGQIAREFVRNCAAAEVLPVDGAARDQVVTRARLGQLATLLGVVLLLYLVVMLARGRLQALLACLAFAGLPAVAEDGHVLRAETVALLGATMGLLLLQCVAQASRPRAGDDGRRLLSVSGLAVCAMLATGLAVAALPASGAWLLVPGIVLSIAAVQIVLRSVRLVRRHGWLRLPVRAINRRLLPWTAMALLAPAVALWLLWRTVPGGVEGLSPAAGLPFLPRSPTLAVAFVVLLLLGAVAALLQTGNRLRRSGRIDAGLVWFAFCAVGFAGALGGVPDRDRLPLAVATASLLGNGLFVVLLLVRRLLVGRAAPTPVTSP